MAHGVAGTTGELGYGEGGEGEARVGAEAEPVKDFVGETVAGAADDAVEGGEVNVLGNFGGVAVVGGGFDGENGAGGLEKGEAVGVEDGSCCAGAAEWVDEDLETFAER